MIKYGTKTMKHKNYKQNQDDNINIDEQNNFLYWQLRVVRAFKSTLEDLEEKRSIYSFHSLHSLRSYETQKL
jgi:hypothetical protein